MSWIHWLLWGFSGTVVLTSILAASQGLGMTRMNVPYLLGTIFTPSRDKAPVRTVEIGPHKNCPSDFTVSEGQHVSRAIGNL